MIIGNDLKFGQQNLLFSDSFIGSEETDDTYEYVISITTRGLILLGQFSENQGRYCVKAIRILGKTDEEILEEYNAIVGARGSYTYVLPCMLEELRIDNSRNE
jgi:hypothetical protein